VSVQRPSTPRSLTRTEADDAEVRELGKRYDENYFLHEIGDMGEPYVRDNPVWKAIFARVAQAIVTELAPKSVLDAGCGIGFLVEALRERGVEAFGLDISEYAIANAADEVRPFCELASITDELTRRYDLIVCMEVLEHLPPHLAPRAVENLTGHTDLVLFSSTPKDFRDSTHLNVQPTEYWVGLFGSRDFFRDPDFDASFVADHAILFRRIKAIPANVLRAYERRYWRTEKELRELRHAGAQTSEEAAGVNLRNVDDQRAYIESLNERLEAMRERQNELRSLLMDANEQLLRRDQELRVRGREEIRLRDEEIEWLRGVVRQRDEEIEWLRGSQAELSRLQSTRAWLIVAAWWRLRARVAGLFRAG